PELGEVLVRLLEVVAEDLLELGPAVALPVNAFGPIDESLVERRPGTLENPLVRSIADEDVVEAVLVLPIGLKGPHELLLGHGAEVLGHRRPNGVGRQLLDRRLLEDLTDHRRRLDYRTLLERKQVQARRQQRLNRPRDRELGEIPRRNPGVALASDQAVVYQHREELLDEEWVPFGRGHDPRPRIVGNRRIAKEVLHDEPALLFGEGLELDRRTAVGPVRPALEQVGSSRADEQK